MVVWKNIRVVNTGMPTKRSSPFERAIISDEIDISDTSNSAKRNCRQNSSDGCSTVGTRSMPSGFTRCSMIGQVRGLSVMPMLSGMRIVTLTYFGISLAGIHLRNLGGRFSRKARPPSFDSSVP